MPTLSDLVASQRALETEASLALPWSFSECTHSRGYIRQPVFLCLTCAVPRGVCASCSIACHAAHEQVELFPKRAFRCDCPTLSLPPPCALLRPPHPAHPANAQNTYNQNFHNAFCRCGREYRASEERETMIQCLACEDWYHESCLNLRERPPPREVEPLLVPIPTSTPPDRAPADPHPSSDPADDPADDTDADTEVSEDPDLPPPLLSSREYDVLLCAACVRKSDVLRRWVGSKGVKVVVREKREGGEWRVLEGEGGGEVEEEEGGEVDVGEPDPAPETTPHSPNREAPTSANGLKRPSSPSPLPSDSERRPAKRARGMCHAPPVEGKLLARMLFPPSSAHPSSAHPSSASSSSAAHPSDDDDDDDDDDSVGPQLESAGDIFLTEGWRARWCQCSACLPQFEGQEYLLQEEPTYSPPPDPDSGLSTEELGLRLLSHLPRAQVIDGIHKYNDMRDRLIAFLRPMAQEGREVGREDIERFFGGLEGEGA